MKNLKDSALFPANVSAFFPALFRNHSGKRPEKHRNQTGKKQKLFWIKAESFKFQRLDTLMHDHSINTLHTELKKGTVREGHQM